MTFQERWAEGPPVGPLSEEDKRDLADGDWWRPICKILGAKLSGWTFRSSATIFYGNYPVDLDGRVARTIDSLQQQVRDLESLLDAEGIYRGEPID